MKNLMMYCWVAGEEKGGKIIGDLGEGCKIITDDSEGCDITPVVVLQYGISDDCGGGKWVGHDDGAGKWKGGDPLGGSLNAFGHGTSKGGYPITLMH